MIGTWRRRRIEHPGAPGAAGGSPDLVRLVQVADDPLEADFVMEIQLRRAERLALETTGSQSLEQIERGHRGAVGEIDDQVCRGEEDLSRGAGPAEWTSVFRAGLGLACCHGCARGRLRGATVSWFGLPGKDRRGRGRDPSL